MLKPNDIGYLCGLNLYNDNEWHVGIGLHRSFEAEPFSDSELNTLKVLYPHLQRALRIHKELHRLRSRQQTLQALLDRLVMGLVILNPMEEVVYCNPVAQNLLVKHQALHIGQDNRLQAYYGNEQQQLQTMINQLNTSDHHSSHSNLAISLHHPDAEHVLNVMIAALNDSQREYSDGKVALYFSTPDLTFDVPSSTLKMLYGMTPAESQVAVALVNGLTPVRIAEIHGVSVGTVRSQLKSIYSKMGVDNQQSVIRTLLSGMLSVR